LAVPTPQADLKQKLADPELNLAIENHEYGIPPVHFDKWPILKEWYNILSTTKDRNGIEYISTVEAVKYPFTGEPCRDPVPPPAAALLLPAWPAAVSSAVQDAWMCVAAMCVSTLAVPADV
jgi:hypothetical protein